MKKAFLSLFSILLAVVLVQAQEDGAKLAKQAGRALSSYNLDPSNNGSKLDEAKTKITQALQQAEVQTDASAWITKGEIYNTILQREMARRLIDSTAKLSGDNDALVAYNAFQKGFDLAEKKYEKGTAVQGAFEVQGHLINIGVSKYEAEEYDKAFQSFEAALASHKLISENENLLKNKDQKSLLNDKGQYENQIYITGLAAQLANRSAEAVQYYEQLYKSGTDKPAIYEGLFNLRVEKGETAAADKILAEGRAKFPKDPGLLFAEINVYLKNGKLEELIGRLKQAIEQEPTNISLYVTLGSVYDNLYQRMSEEKNEAKATEYFTEAKNQYLKAQEIDPTNSDAVYSLGALYYNKAAAHTQELNALPQDDFSAAALKKYNKIKDEIMALFDQALPYFQKAEGLNPNDMNTLIALSEIFARKDDLETASALKKRLEVIQSGGSNKTSYFKQ